MKFSYLFRSVICLGLLFLFNPTAYPQNNQTNGASGSEFSLDFSSDLGGFYFQDINGARIALDGIPYEGIIDENRYELGVNDLISIDVNSGQRLILKNIVINPSGDVVLPSIGAIRLAGYTISEATLYLEEKLSETFKLPKVVLSIEIPRKINIHISGSVPNPGKFIVPAQSRVDLAIIQSLVSDLPRQSAADFYNVYTSQLLRMNKYSLRNIVIHHKDGTSSTADLVQYFRTGNLASNPIILDGDRIDLKRISPNTPTVSITGAVRFGYELEYKSNETILELLRIAEFFEENADSSKVFVVRQTLNDTQKITVSSSDWGEFELSPNDRVIVPEIEHTRLNSTAWVTGEVSFPGNYPIISGETTVAKILDLSGGLTNFALPQASFLIRSGNLENEIPNKFNSELMARTSDQFVQGLEYLKMETALSKDRVYIDLNNSSELDNIPLFEGDRLYVPKDERTIFVFGQVNNPGYLPFFEDQNLTVQDYISRAGGFALSADTERVFVIKVGNLAWYRPEETTIESGDKIFIDRQPIEDLNALRSYEIQREQVKNTRIQLIMTGITTITGIITTYVAIQNIRRN